MIKNHGVVVIVKNKDKILFLKDSRNVMFGHWGPPHGRCELSDGTEENSVIREVFEETSLKVKPIKKLWTTEADTKVETVSFWLAEIIQGEIKIDSNESSEYDWFNVEDALNLKLYPGTEKFLNLVKKGKIRF